MIASVKTEPEGSIRRINVEIPPLSVSDMRRLKNTDSVGTFVLFQETYHRDTFKVMHPSGPKSDFDFRVLTQDRAMRAGLDDVGIGALFGLYDYRYEVSAHVWVLAWHALCRMPAGGALDCRGGGSRNVLLRGGAHWVHNCWPALRRGGIRRIDGDAMLTCCFPACAVCAGVRDVDAQRAPGARVQRRPAHHQRASHAPCRRLRAVHCAAVPGQ